VETNADNTTQQQPVWTVSKPRGAEAPPELPRDTGPTLAFPPRHVFSNQFEVVRLLGKGGMALVYQVLDKITYEHVALKIIRPDCLTHPMSRACLTHELMLARRLRHKNIVAVYDIRREDLQLYFTMEYIDGVTLLEHLRRRGPRPLDEAVKIMRALCAALQHAHETMVHCDVSLENIMVGRFGVKLLDFGISKALHYDPPWRFALGKGSHTAPEQREDILKVDPRADLYSLGVVFFELLTKRTIPKPLEGKFPYPGLTRETRNVIERSVVPLNRRFANITEFAEALEHCANATP